MTTATHLPTKLIKGQFLGAGPTIPFDTSNIGCLMVVQGAAIPGSNGAGVQYLGDVFINNAEQPNIGARQYLTGLTVATDANGIQVDFSFTNVVYVQNPGDPGNARYGIFFQQSATAADGNLKPVISILDLGQLVSTQNGSLTLQSPAGGLIQWTGGG